MKSAPLLLRSKKCKAVKPASSPLRQSGCNQIEMLYRANLHLLDGQPVAVREAVAVQLVLPFLLL
jgi:hypothetical protein